MALYGLIGWPLGHSFSKKYFSKKFEREGILDAQYELFPIPDLAEFPGFLAKNPSLRGLNVTIPHKETILPFLHEIDETARAVGAVNCIKVFDNQHLVGFNTDVIGFEKSLKTVEGRRWTVEGGKALILGTGGAAKAVAYVLQRLGISFQFVSRNPKSGQEIPYSSLTSNHSSLLINTTPLGTFPAVDEMPPVPVQFFRPGVFVYDLIYNPAETLLLREAKARGCAVQNGLKMLELQAEASWEIWRNDH